MTDVVTHADPAPGDGRRGPRTRRAHRGLRAPGTPGTAGTGADTATHRIPLPPQAAEGRARHRVSPGTDPFAVPTGAPSGPSRHRAGPSPAPFDGPVSGESATATTQVVRVGATTDTGRHAATADVEDDTSARRRRLPLRATIGLVGVGGVAALFALTSPGSPVSTSAPLEAAPSSAQPAGLFSPVLPAGPGAPAPAVPSVVPVAPPVASTTPAGEGVQPVIGALFDAAAGAFADLFNNSGNEGLVENGPRPRVVANPDDPSRQAWQFSLGPGGKRSEVLPQGPGTEPVDGEEQYIRYTARLSEDFPTDTNQWQLILQWHQTQPTGSPPLALQVTRGQLMMVSGGDDMQSIGPVSPGDRIDLTMHVKFSQNPGEGAVTVWRDGRPTGVTGWSPNAGTMSSREAYLKMGMYRSPDIRAGGSVLVTDLKIGRDANGIGGIGPRPTR